jgi:hypothetical protein
MTTPGGDTEPVVGASDPVETNLPVTLPAPEPPPAKRTELAELPVVDWAQAIVKGLGDTARQVLREGRRGAQQAYDDGWRRFDDKTRFRRREDDKPPE